jgi:hypothetical protein
MTTTKRPALDLDSLTLHAGAHTPNGTFCLLEAVAYVAGEKWSDHPACVSPVIATFGRSWNDSLPDNAARDRLLKPLIPLMIGTATGPLDEETRGPGWRRIGCAVCILRHGCGLRA